MSVIVPLVSFVLGAVGTHLAIRLGGRAAGFAFFAGLLVGGLVVMWAEASA